MKSLTFEWIKGNVGGKLLKNCSEDVRMDVRIGLSDIIQSQGALNAGSTAERLALSLRPSAQMKKYMTARAAAKKIIPPSWCSFPDRNEGSTLVASIAMVKMRNPFLATDRGITKSTAAVLLHGDRSISQANTMVVISSIRLERILLHTFATSSVNPGIESNKPSCATGTWTVTKSARAANADPYCRYSIIRSSAKDGRGTFQNKNQRGKIRERVTLAPKQSAKLPIHQITNDTILIERRTSSVIPFCNFKRLRIIAATHRMAMPGPMLGTSAVCSILHLLQIRATLTGRISRM
jgi:hypothetical protein